jgi:hypothetical protein
MVAKEARGAERFLWEKKNRWWGGMVEGQTAENSTKKYCKRQLEHYSRALEPISHSLYGCSPKNASIIPQD